MSNQKKAPGGEYLGAAPDLWANRQDFIAGLRSELCPEYLGAAVLLIQMQRGRLSVEHVARQLTPEMRRQCDGDRLVGALAVLAAALARLQPDQAHLLLELSSTAVEESARGT